jgi:SAM-dependent methyltransferase
VVPSYAEVGGEYYDVDRHPTSHAFRQGSARLLRPALVAFRSERVLEVGSGRSLVTENAAATVEVVVTDADATMLTYSRDDGRFPLVQADARRLPFRDAAFDVVVASLGDPYNEPAYWSEMRRVLHHHGLVLYTTPTFGWSHQFRGSSSAEKTSAEFALRDGRTVRVPSHILSEADQRRLIESAGLTVASVESVGPDEIPSFDQAPKLAGAAGAIVTLYTAARR